MHKSNRNELKSLTTKMYRTHLATGAETEADFIRHGYSREEVAAVKETLPKMMQEANRIAA